MSEHREYPGPNAEAIADSKIPPGDDYEEIREQVCVFILSLLVVISQRCEKLLIFQHTWNWPHLST
jgi:hypothetical protein